MLAHLELALKKLCRFLNQWQYAGALMIGFGM